jgi:hypothetical protein
MVKSCLNCKFAEWSRTASGRLHPSGAGKCTYQWKMPELPRSMHWLGSQPPRPLGGFIQRKCEWMDHCAYFQRPPCEEK